MASFEAGPAIGHAVDRTEPAVGEEFAPVHKAEPRDSHLETDPALLRGEPLGVLEQAVAHAPRARVAAHDQLLDRPRDALEAQHGSAVERQESDDVANLVGRDENERARVFEDVPERRADAGGLRRITELAQESGDRGRVGERGAADRG
jgi:hypothetical protein